MPLVHVAAIGANCSTARVAISSNDDRYDVQPSTLLRHGIAIVAYRVAHARNRST